nr:MAG TPA: hypothetical protein [Caudoviricetes sp.]
MIFLVSPVASAFSQFNNAFAIRLNRSSCAAVLHSWRVIKF